MNKLTFSHESINHFVVVGYLKTDVSGNLLGSSRRSQAKEKLLIVSRIRIHACHEELLDYSLLYEFVEAYDEEAPVCS